MPIPSYRDLKKYTSDIKETITSSGNYPDEKMRSFLKDYGVSFKSNYLLN